jgi:hypothetical protein
MLDASGSAIGVGSAIGSGSVIGVSSATGVGSATGSATGSGMAIGSGIGSGTGTGSGSGTGSGTGTGSGSGMNHPPAITSLQTLLYDTHDHTLVVSTPIVSGTDPDGDPITLQLVTGVSNGTLTLNPDATLTYIPTFHFTGSDSFQVKYVDSGNLSSSVVAITIQVMNATPYAGNDLFNYPGSADSYVDIDVLANDHDPDGDPISITSVTSPSDGGTVQIITDSTGYQKLRFTPPSNYNSSDPEVDVFAMGAAFQYTVADNLGAQAVAQVQAQPKVWTPWRLYSRGNDDPNENFYETGKIKVELTCPTEVMR